METNQAIKIMTEHNQWRRREIKSVPHNHKDVGDATEKLIELVSQTIFCTAEYCCMTKESSWSTLSIHRTREEAEEHIQIYAAEALYNSELTGGSIDSFGKWEAWRVGGVSLEE